MLALESGSDRALFVGDLLHSPLQFLAPDVNSCFCEDAAEARATRRRLFERADDTNALVVPAHLAGGGAAEVVRDGAGFAVRSWGPFPRV